MRLKVFTFTVLTLLLPLPWAAGVNPPDQARAVRSRVQPAYPPLARNMHVEGTVPVEVTVSPEGLPLQAHAISGHPLLIAAAEDCAMRWRFVPSHEISREMVTFHFSL